ncbi:MAG: acyl-CoA/acyl-ACP dehydrogenase [Gammaproteobacteria bacterium]|jgi:alkylation response protein AidB-like acyl-CoA dehydrogenase|nr:acyl-CoA/acyl-ACP dehydrogenase [Gammaproteobacteria bacterium]|tara:strand:- start:920 stop:2044 length:1125 start_codon:yes stop_codon:yes gene_type:complete
MQIVYTEEQEQLREVVSRFLQAKSTAVDVRRLMASSEGYDPAVWEQLCGEVGLAGTHIPEEYGGVGFGPVELGIVSEEMGRHLYCGPFFASSVMAGYALLNGATETHKTAILPGIASGDQIATLVLDNLNNPEKVGAALKANEKHVVSGVAPIVIDAHIADVLIVAASTAEGLGLYLVKADAAGLTITPQEALDPTRKLSRVSFNEVSAERIGGLTEALLNRTWDEICSVLAHEMIGGAQYLFESTLEYTKVRVQFGRPIGSFQALKHRCADLLMELEFAKAAIHHAAFCLAAGDGEPYVASMAKAMASDTYMEAARAGVQLRGGIGFTWEEDTHLWFKRAKSSEVFMGSAHMHRERMMTMIETTSSHDKGEQP